MDWGKLMYYAILVIVMNVVIRHLNKKASHIVEGNDGEMVTLVMNKYYRYFAYLGIGLAFLFIVLFALESDSTTLPIFAFMTALFGGIGAFFFLLYKFHFVQFDDKTIRVQDWRKQSVEIYWADIQDLKFNLFTGYIKLSGLHQTLKLHQHLVGIKSFVDQLEKQTKWTSKDLKMPY